MEISKPNKNLNYKPLLTNGSVNWLGNNLNSNMVGLEYGGGGSTLWFLKRLKELYTVEANPNWAIRLIEEVSKDQKLLNKWRLYFVNCNWQIDDVGNRWSIKRNMTEEEMKIMEKSYITLMVQNLDFILIDGTVRYLSIVHSINMLKKHDGILCIDNMELPARQKYVNKIIPKNWKRMDFIEDEKNIPKEYFNNPNHNGQWITSIWVSKC